jgi:hypothetical protein
MANDDNRVAKLRISWELIRDALGLPSDTQLLAVETSSEFIRDST